VNQIGVILSDLNPFNGQISDVKNLWTLAAFAIAAILSVYNIAAKGARRNLWIAVGGICLIALVPMFIDGGSPTIYRLHVTTVDAAGVPIEGATVRTTTTNSASTASDGSCELTIAKGTLNQTGKVTVFADKAPYLHGSIDVTLGSDPNPSLTIPLQKAKGAAVAGIVKDDAGNAVSGARIGIPGSKATTSDNDGNFRLDTQAPAGEEVELHAEKSGYIPIDQRHPAGGEPATLVLRRKQRSR
jgi:hypothetical protein